VKTADQLSFSPRFEIFVIKGYRKSYLCLNGIWYVSTMTFEFILIIGERRINFCQPDDSWSLCQLLRQESTIVVTRSKDRPVLPSTMTDYAKDD
jgi:hypothetical protein